MHLFLKGEEFSTEPLLQLGPEPLDESFEKKLFAEKLAKTKRYIKSALLDQKIVVGLGNIYVDESLFKAGVHPERVASSLTEQEIDVLFEKIIETLTEAVEKGGSTVRTYVNSQGEMGMFQLQHFVYGRKGQDCKVCGTPLIKTVVGGRGTVFCPTCQPK
jgi:formamidopyrimidine-DNA glycosylase